MRRDLDATMLIRLAIAELKKSQQSGAALKPREYCAEQALMHALRFLQPGGHECGNLIGVFNEHTEYYKDYQFPPPEEYRPRGPKGSEGWPL